MAVAVCILYPELIFQNKIFFGGDTQAAVSFDIVGKRALADGVYPMWNPYVFAGMPSFGSLSFIPYVYPVSYVLALLIKFLFFPKYIWLFFHTWLMGIGMYALMREWKIHWAVGMSCGVLMMWMPNLVAVGAHGHGSQAVASGYLPLALLFWDRIWNGKKVVLHAAALGLVLGLSMLRGHLQISYYTYLLVGMHWLFFGVLRLRDGFGGHRPETSPLPARWANRDDASRYSAGTAFAEWGFATLVLGVVVVASLLMCAVLYLPVHDFAQYSIRGASESGGLDYDWATSWSLHPKEIATFFLPYAYGFGKDLYFGYMPFTDYPNYLGLVVLVFAIAAIVLARSRRLGFLGFVAIACTFVAFGKFFPVLYGPLFKFMPFFSKFRVPVMILIVQQMAVVFMFGIGLNAALRSAPEKGKRVAVQGLAVAFFLFMIVVLSQGFWSGGFAESVANRIRGAQTAQQQLMVARAAGTYLRNDLMRFAVMFAGVFVVLFVYFNARRVTTVAAVGLMLLLGMVDFYIVDRNILHPENWRHYEAYQLIHDRSVTDSYKAPDEVVNFLKRDKEPFRVFPMDHPQQPFGRMFYSNRYMNFEIASIGGYHAAKLSTYDEFLRVALPASLRSGSFQLIDMLNTRYIVSGAQLPDQPRFKPLWSGVDYEGSPSFVYENTGAFPRVFFVDRYQVAATRVASLRLLGTGSIDLSRETVLDRKPAIEPVSRQGAEASIIELGYNVVRISARTDSSCLMLLSDAHYPDWRVTVNGTEAEVLRANHVIRAVALGPGTHDVVFRYDTSLVRKGVVTSASTMGFLLLVILGYFFNWLRSRARGRTRLHTNV